MTGKVCAIHGDEFSLAEQRIREVDLIQVDRRRIHSHNASVPRFMRRVK
jgi:hypothetical protein